MAFHKFPYDSLEDYEDEEDLADPFYQSPALQTFENQRGPREKYEENVRRQLLDQMATRQRDPRLSGGSVAGPLQKPPPSGGITGGFQRTNPEADALRILSGTQDFDEATRQFAALYPGTVREGKDVWNIPGVGRRDVLRARSTGAWIPQFLDVEANAKKQLPPVARPDFGPLTGGTQAITENLNDLIAQLLGGSPLSNRFLMQLLQGRR